MSWVEMRKVSPHDGVVGTSSSCVLLERVGIVMRIPGDDEIRNVSFESLFNEKNL